LKSVESQTTQISNIKEQVQAKSVCLCPRHPSSNEKGQ